MKTKKTLTSISLLLFFAASIIAQTGVSDGSKYGHGQDSIDCRLNASLFYEAAKQGSYADALGPWTECFEKCPASTRNIYTYGVKIVGWQIKNAKTAEEREKLITKLMQVFDQRIKYYGNHPKYPEAYILGEKASTLYLLKKDDISSLKEMYTWYLASIKGMAVKSKASNLQEFMAINYELYNVSEINTTDLIDNYEMVQTVLNDQFDATTDQQTKDLLQQVMDANVSNFANSGAADCETLESLFRDKIEAAKEDKVYLEKALNFFEKTGCNENESYYVASEYLHAIEPSAAAAVGIAASYLKRNDIATALTYYNEAISLEVDAEKKAKYYYTIGLLQFTKENNFESARRYARLAIKENPAWGDPYILIGDLYQQSAQKGMLGKKDVENLAGYWVATDMYEKAKKVDPSVAEKATNLIKLYSNYFPNKEIIFFEPDYEEGKIVNVGGWINEKTICRAKK